MPNIGARVEAQLNTAGITAPEELRTVGARGARLKIQSIDPSAWMHRLLARGPFRA